MSGAVAIGVVRGVSQGAFDILKWDQADNLWRFHGTDSIENGELHQKNYLAIIARAMGYWMRGNYLVVKFLHGAQFQFLRGSSNRDPQPL